MRTRKHQVSVIILTRNSVATIEKSIRSVFQQTRQPDEVIVVDGNSQDGTLEIVRKYPIKLVTEPGLGFGYARNLGVRNASGDIIAFVDSDCVLEENYLKELLSALNSVESDVGGVGGVIHSQDSSLVSDSFNVRFFGYSPFNETRIREVDSLGGGACAYSKELVLRLGGFDDTLMGGEDLDLSVRFRKAGYRLLVVPSAKIYHFHPSSLKHLVKKWFFYGQFIVDVSVKKGYKKDLLLSWGWVSSCLVLLGVAFLTGQLFAWLLLLLTFWLPWAFYYSGQTVRFLLRKRKAKYLALPFVHQAVIVSRSLGVVVATLGHLSKMLTTHVYSISA